MQMFRQQHKSVNVKRMTCFRFTERRSQQFPVFRFAQDFAPTESHNRKKVSSPRRLGAAILHIKYSNNVQNKCRCRLGISVAFAQHSSIKIDIAVGIFQHRCHIRTLKCRARKTCARPTRLVKMRYGRFLVSYAVLVHQTSEALYHIDQALKYLQLEDQQLMDALETYVQLPRAQPNHVDF